MGRAGARKGWAMMVIFRIAAMACIGTVPAAPTSTSGGMREEVVMVMDLSEREYQ